MRDLFSVVEKGIKDGAHLSFDGVILNYWFLKRLKTSDCCQLSAALPDPESDNIIHIPWIGLCVMHFEATKYLAYVPVAVISANT